MTTAFPPTRSHHSTRIPISRAHALLSSYLSRAASDPSLLPNALFTEDGPTNPAGAQMGLVMHNLQRVEAGLRGEYLGADLEVGITMGKEGVDEEEEGEGEGGGGVAGGDAVVVDPGTGNGTTLVEKPSEGRVGDLDAEMADEWQDRGEFEREQEDVAGEIGERGYGGPDGVKVPKVERGDKEARKRAKMERRKREKEEEEKRRREKEAESKV